MGLCNSLADGDMKQVDPTRETATKQRYIHMELKQACHSMNCNHFGSAEETITCSRKNTFEASAAFSMNRRRLKIGSLHSINRELCGKASRRASRVQRQEMFVDNSNMQIAKHCQCRKMTSSRSKRRIDSGLFDFSLFDLRRKYSVGCKVSSLRKVNQPFCWRSFVTLFFYVILMTSSFSKADYYSDYVSLFMKSYSKSACDEEYLRIDCPEGSSIDVLGAMYGRKLPSGEMCPSTEWEEASGAGKSEFHEDTNCEAKAGAECQDQRICRLLVHRRVFGSDPCPGTSKYLTVRYQCAPKDFHEQSNCAGKKIVLRCRQDTVISVFKITPRRDRSCQKVNKTECTMTKRDIFDDLSAKCHSKERCSYTLPTAACFNRLRIIHTCVPKQFLTSELPTSDRLYTTTTTSTTTTTTAAETTEYQTTEASTPTVQSTVTTQFIEEGDLATFQTSTSIPVKLANTSENSNSTNQGNVISTTAQFHDISNTSFQVATDVTGTIKPDDDVIIHNGFPPILDKSMESEGNTTQCENCTNVNITMSQGGFYGTLMKIYTFFKENSDDVLIAVLLAIVSALLLTICVLVFRFKHGTQKTKERRETEETREDNRQSTEEHYTVAETHAPVEEDEHENMSLLGSILQRSVDSNHVTSRAKMEPEEEEEGDKCGPKSIFARICCNCCCSNAPWQRTRILKRHRGGVYRVPHRYSEDEDSTGRYRSNEAFPVFSRTEDNVDNRSPIPVLEDHINRIEYPIVTSENVTSPQAVMSQSQQQVTDFRPISRNAQRQYSATPEPDSQYRTQQSTFLPPVRHENQRSDPALNRYDVRQQYNVAQPLTAPTSPVTNHHGNHVRANGAHKIPRAYPASTPKSLPVMGQSMLQTPHQQQQQQPPQSPITPKYTPPSSQYYSTQHYPTFAEAYEQYDNAQQQQTQMVVRRKQYPQRPQDYHPTQPQYGHPHYSNNYPGYHPQSPYTGDHFVQAVPRRTIPSNARTVDLAANARTVDLSHDNSLSRNSWLEIRRSSIYDNSLPRNSEMYEFYQQQLLHQEMQHALQHELPGSRNLNQYYG